MITHSLAGLGRVLGPARGPPRAPGGMSETDAQILGLSQASGWLSEDSICSKAAWDQKRKKKKKKTKYAIQKNI